MTRILEIDYEGMSPWAPPLRAAIDATAALAVRDAEWQQTRLVELLTHATHLARKDSPFGERLRPRGVVWLEPRLAGRRDVRRSDAGSATRAGVSRVLHPAVLALHA